MPSLDVANLPQIPAVKWADIQKYMDGWKPSTGQGDSWSEGDPLPQPVNIPGLGLVTFQDAGGKLEAAVLDPASRTMKVLSPDSEGGVAARDVAYGKNETVFSSMAKTVAPMAAVIGGGALLGGAFPSIYGGVGAGAAGGGSAAGGGGIGLGGAMEGSEIVGNLIGSGQLTGAGALEAAGLGGAGAAGAGSGLGGTLTAAAGAGGAVLPGAAGTAGATGAGAGAGAGTGAGAGVGTSAGTIASGVGAGSTLLGGAKDIAKTIGAAVGGSVLLDTLTKDQEIKVTDTKTTSPLSQEEKDLIDLNKQLAQKQLTAIDQASAYQKQLTDFALAELERQKKNSDAYDLINTPEKIAADAERQRQIDTLQLQSAQQEADRAAKLGPIQEELLQMELDQLRQGGKATPEQLATIKAAADAGIAAGNFDIDAATQRGIGLISDELANSRGLRLSDSPMSSEAALLAREGLIQKGSLEKNLRSGEATAALDYPLAVQQVQTAGITGQQSLATAATQFQDQLRQQAYSNRLALTGQTQSGGIGLSSIGSGNSALNALTQARLSNSSNTTTQSKGIGLGEIGSLIQGLGTSYLAFNKG